MNENKQCHGQNQEIRPDGMSSTMEEKNEKRDRI